MIARGAAPMPHKIKIDVEGSEFAVLHGLSGTIARQRLRLVFEGDANLADHIRSFGFTVCRLERIERTHHNLANFIAFQN
jgi:hypothetical protein